MTDSPDSHIGERSIIASRQSSIPIRSIYLQSSKPLDASISINRPPASSSINRRWKIDKLPARALNPPLNPSISESDWLLQLEPPWTRISTREPLSPGLRAGVRQDLMKSWYFSRMEEYRVYLKASWFEESFFLSIRDSVLQLESRQLRLLCNKLTSFYWMPSAKFHGSPLPLLPFGCLFKEWFKYHNNEPDIEFMNFFAHLLRVYPTGPTTVEGIVRAHRTLCTEAALLLERSNNNGEAREHPPNTGGPGQQSRNHNLKATYYAIIMMMDQYIEPGREGGFTDLEEHSKNQTILLVRTGDESHLSAPINFEALRANGLCLPLARTDFLDTGNDVVRVSLANAVKFIADLQRREDTISPQPRANNLEAERKAKEWTDGFLKEADVKGIDNVPATWTAVRRVKATRMGETFAEREPYPFNRYWR